MDLGRRVTELTEECQKHSDGICSTSCDSNDGGQGRERISHVVVGELGILRIRAEDSF